MKKIPTRNWNELSEFWSAVAPGIDPPGSAPESSVGELFPVAAAIQSIPENVKYEKLKIEGVQTAVLHEAIYLLHKAANVLGGWQMHLTRGLCSWSISGAYQCSLFSVGAICSFLGVTVIRVDGHHVLLDVWPARSKGSAKLDLAKPSMDSWCAFIKGRPPSNQDRWKVFQRLLRVAKVPESMWAKVPTHILSMEKSQTFVKQRNAIHYSNHYWPHPDLHDYMEYTKCFNVPADWSAPQNIEDPDSPEFSLVVSMTTFAMAYAIFSDLVNVAPSLLPELDCLRRSLGRDCNVIYKVASK